MTETVYGGGPPEETPVLRQAPDVGGDGALSEEEFRELVVTDAKGRATAREQAFLRSAAVVGRWNTALASLNRELQSQFAERRAEAQAYRNRCLRAGPRGKREWFDYQERYAGWRAGATRLKGLVEERLAESKELVRAARKSAASGGEPSARASGDASAEASAEASGPLLSEVAEFLSADGIVREPFVRQRDGLLQRISAALALPGAPRPRRPAGAGNDDDGSYRKGTE